MILVSLRRYVIINQKAEEMWEDLGLDGETKTGPMGSGRVQRSHTVMLMMIMDIYLQDLSQKGITTLVLNDSKTCS
jgi:hypothetical protein